MRKLARVLLNVLMALSLLMCVAACVLWVRSYSRADRVTYGGESLYSAFSTRGTLYLAFQRTGPFHDEGWCYKVLPVQPRDRPPDAAVFGFEFDSAGDGKPYRGFWWGIGSPWWAVVLLAA